MTDQSRSEFEAWCTAYQSFPMVLDPMFPGQYEDMTQQIAWDGYREGRRAALEEAAKLCEDMRDLKEAKKAQERADEAIGRNHMDDMLHRLRHCSTVSLFNGALERAAKSIRALSEAPDTSIHPPSIDASSGRVDSIDAER